MNLDKFFFSNFLTYKSKIEFNSRLHCPPYIILTPSELIEIMEMD